MQTEQRLTRRRLLAGGAALGVSSTLASAAQPALAATRRRPVGLPTPRQVRAEFTHMVKFGPRLGWIDAHPDLVNRAVAALTVEHLGCTEWIDTVEDGYRPTGQPEMFAVWTTQGEMFQLTISPGGELDKLDERLAARQIAWLADLATKLDKVPASQLRQGDLTLGAL
jgi:hypothetical protein